MNLTNFNSKELQTLLEVVVSKIVEEHEHKKEWIERFGEGLYNSDIYYDEIIRPHRDVNYEHLCLWRTQILDAIGKVGVREMVASN